MYPIMAVWCSFCTSREAGGHMNVDDVSLPVCDYCMENYDENVAPLVEELLSDDP